MSRLLHKLYAFNAHWFRGRRFRSFLEICQPRSTDRVLDLGGTREFWKSCGPIGARLDIIDIRTTHDETECVGGTEIRLLHGDGCALKCSDANYDLVFSNSVIEHVGDWEKQQAFAREAMRVGRKLWIQTPAKGFPIEPHYLTLFLHWLPKAWQKKLIPYVTVWGLLDRPTAAQIDELVDDLRLLTLDDMRRLFPGCRIYKERFLGIFVKSYAAYR